MEEIKAKDLGVMKYEDAWKIQQSIFDSLVKKKRHNRRHPEEKEQIQSEFLFVEHPHVYTLGKRGDINNLLLKSEELNNKGISLVNVNRGGDITYHGPGQIVCYPILDLEKFNPDIHLYVRMLEDVIIRTLLEYGIKSERNTGETGVWIDSEKPTARKICAIGVRTSQWITMHGLALNVNTDLSFFDGIVPCGILGKSVTSMQAELNKELDMGEVKEKIKKNFQEVFSAKIRFY